MTKNILIVGSSGDIGVAIARKMAGEGYHLILHYHTNETVIVKMRQEFPEECILTVIQADLATEDGVEKLLNEMVFSVDGIIFANGRSYFELFQYTTDQMMDAMLMQHVKAPWKITRSLLPMMIRKQTGRIVFITSIWGEKGAGNEVIYSSVKGAQNSFIKALAKEVATSGIYANGISPGFIATKMNAHLSEEENQAVIDKIPMQRAGSSDEIAEAVRYLMIEQTTYIQGEIIHITGGW